jgi:hypothetical protein
VDFEIAIISFPTPFTPFTSLCFTSLRPLARTAIAILDLRHPTKDVVLLQLVLIRGANYEHSPGLLFLSSAKAGAVAPVTCGGCMGIRGNVCAFSLVTRFRASNVKSGSAADWADQERRSEQFWMFRMQNVHVHTKRLQNLGRALPSLHPRIGRFAKP